VMLVVCLPLLVWTGGRIVFVARDIAGLGGVSAWNRGPDLSVMLKTPSPAGRLLVEGARGGSNDDARWRPLWESAPDDPRFLAQYTMAYFGTHKRLSPEIVAAAARIDPDNGWFLILEAAGIAKHAVTRDKLSEKDRKAGKAARMTIHDTESVDRALALVRKARSLPQFETYQTELHRMRMEQVRPAEDIVSSAYLGLISAAAYEALSALTDAGNLLAASALRCSESGDATGFDRIVDDWLWLYRMGLQEADTMIGQMLARVIVSSSLRHFRDAARKLGREDQADRFNSLDKAVWEHRERVNGRNDRFQRHEMIDERGSILGSVHLATSSMVLSPPEIREEDLKPGRLADHAMLDRLFTGGRWGLIGCVVMSVAFSRRGPRILAGRLVRLLDWRDWAWLLGAGVLVPVGWFLLITRVTPLSAREWAIMRTLGAQSGAQHLALLLLLVLAPLAVARWRIGLNGRMLGLAAVGLKWDLLALCSVAVAIPAFGLDVLVCRSIERMSLAAALLFGWPVVRELVLAWRHSRPSSPQVLWHHAVARAALPAWVFAMLLCGIALRVHEAEERHWVRANQLLEIPSDQPVMSRYEAELVKILSAETEALLRPLDAISGK